MIIKEVKNLIDLVSVIGEFSSETQFKFEEDGISFIVNDPANVGMLVIKINEKNIEHYEVREPVGVNTPDFLKILKKCKDANEIDLDFGDKVVIKASNKKFTIPAIDLGEETTRVPELVTNTKVEMYMNDFVDVIESIGVVADSVKFVAGEPMLFKGEEDHTFAEVETSVLSSGDLSTAKYSIDYLKKLLKAKGLSNSLVLEYSTDYPLKATVVNDFMKLEFILAPRIEG